MVLAGNMAKRLSSVNHATKAIHHHHHHHHHHQKLYAQIDLEATGIVFALQSFRNFIVGPQEHVTVVSPPSSMCYP